MAQLAAWLLLCLAIAWFLQDRVPYAVAVVIFLWSAVPALGGHHVIGISNNGVAFHPATWLIVCIFVVQLVMNPVPIGAAMARHYLVVLIAVIFALGALITSRLTGSGGNRLLMDQIVGPFLLWWLIVAAGAKSRQMLVVVRGAILLAMAAQSILAIIQLALGQIIFYSSDYEKLVWFNPEVFNRWMGTADSPLVLSLGVCIAGALAVGLHRALLRFSFLGLFMVATVITQSRTGAAVMILIIVYAIVRSHMSLWARALASALVVGTGLYLAGSVIVEGLSARFANDTGSTDARVRALSYIFDHWSDFLFVGQGLISSYTVARNAGLETSLENSYLMYVIDTGVILATLWFGVQLGIVARYGAQVVRGLTLAAALGTLLQHTFSAAAFANMTGTLVWSTLGLLVVAWTLTPERQPAARAIGAPAAASVKTSDAVYNPVM